MSKITHFLCIRCNSRQFNFGLHAKIDHIEFEDKYVDKNYEYVEYFLSKDC